MKGKKRVIIQNNRVHYEFVIKRNITIIQGDSASGKTTLVNMIRQAENLGESSQDHGQHTILFHNSEPSLSFVR